VLWLKDAITVLLETIPCPPASEYWRAMVTTVEKTLFTPASEYWRAMVTTVEKTLLLQNFKGFFRST